MATARPPPNLILAAKPQVKIETSSGEITPTLSNGKELKKSKSALEEKGTVLLRHPLPKYSFMAKQKSQSGYKNNGNGAKSKASDQKYIQPVANVAPSIRGNKEIKNESHKTPININSSKSGTKISSHDTSDRSIEEAIDSLSFTDISNSESSSSPNNHYETELQKMKEERDQLKAQLDQQVGSLKKQLDIQLQINSELKRLLVASVGDDLHFRMEHLVRDKAQLSKELVNFSKKLSDDYEHLDKISIQADMWRSKFLASRVMIDELASAKAFYAMQFQDSQNVLQQMLNERHELRRNLFETYRCLEQIKSAFDPLNADKSTKRPSSNALDLARINQRLAENVRYRLLPSDVTSQTIINMDTPWEDTLTYAETQAQSLLTVDVDLTAGSQTSRDAVADRFHPYAKFDNLTLNCCERCQGEITAL